MFESLYGVVITFFDYIGLTSFFERLFSQPNQIASITAYEFFYYTFAFVFVFFAIWIIFKLFVGIINKFIEVIKYD